MSHFVRCEKTNSVLFNKVCVDGWESSTAIIVPDTHNAIIVKDGIALETLSSGKYFIFDKKKPNYIELLEDADTIDVIFISKTLKLNINWGTSTQFDMRDPITNIPIKLGASGEYEVQISNPRKAYLELIGVDETFNADKLKERLLCRLLSEVQFQIANAMREKGLSYDRLGEILLPMSQEIYPHLANLFEQDYGLKMYSFTIMRIIISDEDVKRIISAREKIESKKENKENDVEKERLLDKSFDQSVYLKKLEQEDYAKYLEVCKIVGWPAPNAKKSIKETSDITCRNCGTKIPSDIKFCPKCGVATDNVKIKCPSCKKSIGADEVYCHYCGSKVHEEE